MASFGSYQQSVSKIFGEVYIGKWKIPPKLSTVFKKKASPSNAERLINLCGVAAFLITYPKRDLSASPPPGAKRVNRVGTHVIDSSRDYIQLLREPPCPSRSAPAPGCFFWGIRRCSPANPPLKHRRSAAVGSNIAITDASGFRQASIDLTVIASRYNRRRRAPAGRGTTSPVSAANQGYRQKKHPDSQHP